MRAAEPEPLRRGKAFHKKVQADWHETAEGDVETEKTLRRLSGRRGRMDIFIGGDDSKALVEIKATDWDRMTDKNVRRNIRRQVRQVWSYIEAQPNEANGVCPGIIFPRAPRDPGRRKLVEDMFYEEGIVAVWQDEVDGGKGARGDPVP